MKQQTKNRTLILHETPSGNEFPNGFERAGDIPNVDGQISLSIAAQMHVGKSRIPDRVEGLVVE